MKKFILCLFILTSSSVYMNVQAQEVLEVTDSTLHLVTKNDGTEYVGYILKKDARELLFRTLKVGDIYIPMHEIAEIKKLDAAKLNSNGNYLSEDIFGTRYFITTNALPLDKGETYAVIQWWGPEVHYGATDRLGIGVMTSWVAVPLIFDFKYTIPLGNEKTNLAFGALLGTGSWAALGSFGALPFASITFGDKSSNISFIGGGFSGNIDGDGTGFQPLGGISGLAKLTPRISFVFDSFIVLPSENVEGISALVIPGLRFQSSQKKAFQFGFTGLVADGEALPVPIPMVSWFIKL